MDNYILVKEYENIKFFSKFLPYAFGSPSEDVTFDDQYRRANFLFFTDSHVAQWHSERIITYNTVDTIEFANNSPVKFDAIIHGGDILSRGDLEKSENLVRARQFFELIKDFDSPFIFTKGNHDLNDWPNPPENVICDKDWSELFLDWAEDTYGIVRQTKKNGEKSTWHYYDVTDKKIRIIALDIQDTDKTTTDENGNVKYYGGNSWYFSQEQMDWIISDALNFDDKEEKDWGVIFTFHQYPDDISAHQNAGDVLLDVCHAFNTQGKYTLKYTFEDSSFYTMDINANFTKYAASEKKPHIICWLLGHNHEDRFENKKGIHIIWTPNHCCTPRYSDSRIVRIKGTSTQNCFDVLNVDTLHRKIRVFRYGAQTNCHGVPTDRFLPDGLSY